MVELIKSFSQCVSDITMSWQAVPLLQPLLSGRDRYRPLPPKVEALRDKVRAHPQ